MCVALLGRTTVALDDALRHDFQHLRSELRRAACRRSNLVLVGNEPCPTLAVVKASASKICFVTAATESFVPGTLVALGSFLKHHPGFDGDLVVVHDGLPQKHRRHLAAISSAVRFEPISAELRVQLAALSAERPALAGRLGQFYSLEAFRLHGYRKVLSYDSANAARPKLPSAASSPT